MLKSRLDKGQSRFVGAQLFTFISQLIAVGMKKRSAEENFISLMRVEI
jgi:hypothetical protein